MKIIYRGNVDAPMPHRCHTPLWNLVYDCKVNLYAEVHCSCGYLWKLVPKVSLWVQLFGEYHIAGSAYWIRTGYREPEDAPQS